MAKKVNMEEIRKKWRNHTTDEIKISRPTFVIGPNITIINIEINTPHKLVGAIDNLHTVDGISIHKGEGLIVVHGEFAPTDEICKLVEFSNIAMSVADAIAAALHIQNVYNIAIDTLNERLKNTELDSAHVVYRDPEDTCEKSEAQDEDDLDSEGEQLFPEHEEED